MAAHFYIHDGDSWVEITDRVNLTTPPQLRENAEEGSVAMSTIVVDDRDMDLVISPWMPFVATEDESESDDKVWAAGRLASRTVMRFANSHMDPFGRYWSCELVDTNEKWHRRIFKAADANRDEENDNERVEWVLEQMQDWGLVDDITTYVTAGADSGDLDAEDFRGRYPDDVMGQTSEAKSKNWWIQRQGDVGGDIEDFAWWGSDGNGNYTSPLFLTNDLAELEPYLDAIDGGGSDVWPLIRDHGLRCSPDRMYSGAYARHRSGAIYRRDSGTVDLIGVRDVVMAGTDQLTKARATTRATRYLDEFDVEDFRVTARLRLPASKVTQLRAGMRVPVKMTHWPYGFDEWFYWRVMAVAVTPPSAGTWYELDLELASTGDAADGPADAPYAGDAFAGIMQVVDSEATTLGFAQEGDTGGGGWFPMPSSGPLSVVEGDSPFSTITTSEPIVVRTEAQVITSNVIDNGPWTITLEIRRNGVDVLGSDTLNVPGGLQSVVHMFSIDVHDVVLDADDIVSVHVVSGRSWFWTNSTNEVYLRVGRGTHLWNSGTVSWTGP